MVEVSGTHSRLVGRVVLDRHDSVGLCGSADGVAGAQCRRVRAAIAQPRAS